MILTIKTDCFPQKQRWEEILPSQCVFVGGTKGPWNTFLHHAFQKPFSFRKWKFLCICRKSSLTETKVRSFCTNLESDPRPWIFHNCTGTSTDSENCISRCLDLLDPNFYCAILRAC